MTVEDNPELLDGCERSRGSIDFANEFITDASVLSSIRWIDGRLNFFQNPDLASLAGLERLEHVGGNLSVRYGGNVEDLAPLARLLRVNGLVHISDNPALRSLQGLERLEEVGGLILDIDDDFRDVVSLDSLESLHRVRGDAELSDIRRAEVDAFLERVEVDGTVTLDGEVIAGGEGDASP